VKEGGEKRFKVKRFILPAMVAAISGISCTALPPVQSPDPGARVPSSGKPREDGTLRLIGASPKVDCAAVAVSPRLAVTALHCAQWLCGATRDDKADLLTGCGVEYAARTGFVGKARVVKGSDEDLLALLETPVPIWSWVSTRCETPQPGELLYTVGHPRGAFWSDSYGRLVRGPERLEWEAEKFTLVLTAELPTAAGSSGGGLFDAVDRLLGVQIQRWSPWTGRPDLASFIDADRIRTMVASYCRDRADGECPLTQCDVTDEDLRDLFPIRYGWLS